MSEDFLCPCGSNKSYKECCKIAHSNILDVKTAEQLMRSRYSAFALANSEYLHKSHHSTTRPNSEIERAANIAWAKSVKWIKLEIISTKNGLKNDDKGNVEFKAHYVENGIPNFIHENSSFTKENGHWVYLDGCFDFHTK